MPEEYRQAHIAGLERYLETGVAHVLGRWLDVEGLRKDGVIFPIELRITETWVRDHRLFTAAARDLTKHKLAEAALNEQHEWFVGTLSSIGDAVIATDTAGRVTFMNPMAETLTGWTATGARGRDLAEIFQIVNEETGQRIESPVVQILREGVVVNLADPTLLITRDGAKIPIDDSGAPIRDNHGKILGVVLVFRDITQRRRAEAASRFLAEASSILATSLDYEVTLDQIAHLTVPTMADWCVVDIVEPDQQIRRLAQAHAFPEKLGLLQELQRNYPPGWDSPQPGVKAIRERNVQFLQNITDTVVAAHTYDARHAEIIKGLDTRSAIAVPVIAHDRILGAITVAFAESGRRYDRDDLALTQELAHRAAIAVENARLYQAMQRALEERDRAIAQVEAERARLHALFMQAPAAICSLSGPQHVFTFVNPRYQQLVDPRDVMGKPVRAAVPEVEGQGYFEMLDNVYATGEAVYGTETPVWLDSQGDGKMEELFFNFVFQPTRDASGAVDGILVHAVEVTEQVRTRRGTEALLATIHEQREWFRTTLSSIGDAVIATDENSDVTFMNPVAEALTGWAEADAAGRPLPEIFKIVNEDTREPVENPVLRVLREGVIVGLANHTILIARDGTEIPIDDSGAPIRDKDGGIVGAVLVFRDITERKQAESILLERMRLAALGADIGTALTQDAPLAKLLLGCNDAFVRHIQVACACIWTRSRTEDLLILQSCAGPAAPAGEGYSRVPIGSFAAGKIARERQPLLTNAVIGDPLFQDQEWAARMEITAFAGYPLVVEDRLVGVVGMFARRRLSEAVLQAIGAVANEIALGIERKWGEEERLELIDREQAALAEAQAAVQIRDQFLSIASHELKTPLTSLKGYAELFQRRAQREGTLSERDQRAVQVIIEQATRLSKMINALLDLSRIQTGQLSIDRDRVDLSALISQLTDEVRPTLTIHTLELSCPDEPLIIEGDALRLEQVLQNLLQNAIKYSPDGGRIGVRADRNGQRARIAITDQGIGIPASALPKLFQRFYRATNVESQQISGIGIGLYVVKEIITLHDGEITVDSVEGQGSTFTLYLPLAPEVGGA